MTKRNVLITPSILSCDLGHLQKEMDSIENLADWIQVDVMDGHFVPNLTFGAPVMACVKTRLPLDIHLMVSNPHEHFPAFLKLRAAHITFHAEAVTGTAERKHFIEEIRKGGATAGIALNPGTPLSAIKDIVDDVDLVLVMSVHPGFSGQKFISEVLEKVKELRASHPDLMIQMDGGINDKTAPLCIAAGADNLVAASYIFKADDRAKAITTLRGA